MTRQRAHSPQTLNVLSALAVEPKVWRHGYDLCAELGLKSGSLYPILIRLCDRGYVDSTWESPGSGRPPRHLYRITGAGLREAAAADRAPARAPRGQVRLGTT